ncbi:immunoglobulin superfamily member 5 isoform X1 [Pantherophis guttatus]|uniref:immunoglobulin superfamily member 5 isoform X1 n=2 Tax=Pantherophis guttatus TaxID=94885 RepID=UPI0014836F3F|nr:immunoglobulin superfamily member 5 isoform X1 [Pantherophis guttatus]XP_060550078.1 immunoglobulin superfamily member 5 isoform X1 [Pantherophis guttatus]
MGQVECTRGPYMSGTKQRDSQTFLNHDLQLKRFKETACSMDKLQRWTGLIITLMVYLTDPGFGYAIVEGPQNLTVVVGSVARFSCTVSDGWKILIWLFNGNPKLSVLSTGETIVTDEQYTQKGSNISSSRFTSELMIHNVQLTNSGQIRCSLQNNDNRYAFLSVQIGCDNEDWRIRTIILAVVLSVALLLLLILIILLIICCCKRRKESNYQSELRNISWKKEKGRNLETVSHRGKENYGYSAEQMPRDHTSFPVTEIVYDTKKDLSVSSSSEVLKNEFQAGRLPSRTNVYPINPVKIRNVTLI